MTAHPDHDAEQRYLDRAYARIDAMRAAAQARRDEVIAHGKGGTFQAREEREAIVQETAIRLQQLRLGDEPLCFGRIDHRDGERYYIGRLGVSDEDQEQLIVDWRAPVAEPFYRATGRHPMGLVLRRHFLTDGPKITGIEDEVLDVDALDEGTSLAGEGALIAALERSRTGAMRDIVATIQAEQDEIIRAGLAGVLIVQGGPGTGKTAVALHRAAYLLYTHRFPLERQGVLVVGPNPLFLRYIEHVLPSLGESGVHLSTVSGLYEGLGRARSDRFESATGARVKGDARMAKVIAKAVRDRQRPLPRDAVIPFGASILRLTVDDSQRIVKSARRRSGSHTSRRAFVETETIRLLYERYVETARLRGAATVRELTDFTDDIRDSAELAGALDRMWPLLTPEELLHDLFGAPALIELAASRVLNHEERGALHRPRAESFETIPWTSSDIPLLDEASVLLGRRKKKKSEHGVVRTFGHVVVDEAQDLTPMQLRMLARRSLGSMTVVGDIGQATGPHSPRSWDDVVAHLPRRRSSRTVELTVNYRTPSEIMDLAARVLAVAAPELAPPTSVRSVGSSPYAREAAGGEPAQLAAAAMEEATVLQSETAGAVVVICPPSLAAALGAVREEDIDLEAPISVVPVGTVKGLEFDGVVVVEPARIVEESAQGLRSLYVAMTRATKRLTFVHHAPLPAVLDPVTEGVH